jgi:uncharacterized membrane protein YcaP (DUF421 family)
MIDILRNVDWKVLLLGEENWNFLLETAFRTFIMFIVILLSLRMLGKRGIKQLSVFELGVIIGLGSAAGDPMFYKDVGLLPGIIVFAIVIGLYRLITLLINRSNKFEQFVEGTPTCIIEKGKFLVSNFKKEPIAMDEFFSQLRLNSVSHLGQVQQAILETNGELSIYYCPNDQVSYGLPIIPSLCTDKLREIPLEDVYACTFCGNTEKLKPAPQHICSSCKKDLWLKAIDEKRIY